MSCMPLKKTYVWRPYGRSRRSWTPQKRDLLMGKKGGRARESYYIAGAFGLQHCYWKNFPPGNTSEERHYFPMIDTKAIVCLYVTIVIAFFGGGVRWAKQLLCGLPFNQVYHSGTDYHKPFLWMKWFSILRRFLQSREVHTWIQF